MTTKDYIATYKGNGIETNVDFKAQFAHQNSTTSARSSRRPDWRAMIGEEAMLLGGDRRWRSARPATPTLAASNTGGSLATGTLSVDLSSP